MFVWKKTLILRKLVLGVSHICDSLIDNILKIIVYYSLKIEGVVIKHLKQPNKLNDQINWNDKKLKIDGSSLMYLVPIITYIK